MGFQLALFVGLGGVAPLFILHWAGVRQWALIGIPLLCAAASVWRLLRFLKQRGIETKANYVAYGGNPAGTSDLLFGQVSCEITPDAAGSGLKKATAASKQAGWSGGSPPAPAWGGPDGSPYR